MYENKSFEFGALACEWESVRDGLMPQYCLKHSSASVKNNFLTHRHSTQFADISCFTKRPRYSREYCACQKIFF